MKRDYYYRLFNIDYFFLFILLLCCVSGFAQHNRVGWIGEYSSDSEYRKYFKDNILDLDPIEGIYQVETFVKQHNGFRELPTLNLDSDVFIIYKDESGVFRLVDDISTVQRIGDSNYYNFVKDWGESNVPVTSSRFLFNDGVFQVIYEMPYQIKAKINQEKASYLQVRIVQNFVKEYPTKTVVQEAILQQMQKQQETQENAWSGTAFALNNGYIVTNHHVIDGAKSIFVQGIKGDFSVKYTANVVASDYNNDIALLKINDSRFSGFGSIPYSIKTAMADVGEDIFTLGYPLTSTMGDEIKLTTGIISSKTGYQGDIALYQMSAPVQPGNSGGPLFDSKGNLIGIVSGKHKGTENVGYAIKTSYLKNLVESSISGSILPINNQIAGVPLTNKVKRLRNFVFMISCSNRSVSSSAFSSIYTIPSSSIHVNRENEDIEVINPEVSSVDVKGLEIKKVQVLFSRTIIDLEYDNSVNNAGWIAISPDTYIISCDTGEKHRMVLTEGIPTNPRRYDLSSYEKIQFRLIFPALPKNTTKFNLIEEGSSGWKFYGIKLQ